MSRLTTGSSVAPPLVGKSRPSGSASPTMSFAWATWLMRGSPNNVARPGPCAPGRTVPEPASVLGGCESVAAVVKGSEANDIASVRVRLPGCARRWMDGCSICVDLPEGRWRSRSRFISAPSAAEQRSGRARQAAVLAAASSHHRAVVRSCELDAANRATLTLRFQRSLDRLPHYDDRTMEVCGYVMI